jgi:hypothetical protein
MATYYAKHNAGGGGVGSFADPFTLQELLDNTDAGDLGLVCNTGNYTPAATIDVDNASACTLSNLAVIRGANADGSDDGTIATISGASLGGGADLFNLNVAGLSIKFEGLRITGATQYNINLNTALNVASISFYRCRIDSASSHGIYNQESTAQFIAMFINCEIDTNGSCGIASAGLGRGGVILINSAVHDNASDGIQDTQAHSKSEFIASLIYDNGGHGINLSNDSYGITIRNCVFFANTSNGINFDDSANTGQLIALNNIFRSNGGYGIDTNGGASGQFVLCDYNCFSNNTSGPMDIATLGSNNVLADPLFTDETDGAEDFTLQAGSPCKNTGLDPYGY